MSVLTLKQVSMTRHGAPLWAPIDLELHAGELLLICGSTGCGKSTLLQLMAGLIDADSGQTSRPPRVGLVLQDPSIQMLRDQIGAEVAVLLEHLQTPPEQMQPAIEAALQKVGLDLPLTHRTDALSQGQRYRLLVASQLVACPTLLLLDEPWAQMDELAFGQLQQMLIDLKQQGITIVITEHNQTPWQPIADRQISLDGTPSHSVDPIEYRLPSNQLGQPLLRCNATVLALGEHRQLQLPKLQLNAGQRTLLSGANGCGKSSLLRALATLDDGLNGQVKQQGLVAICLQQPAKQLFATTVMAELCFSLRRAGVTQSDAERQAQQILEQLQLTQLAQRSPYALSYGQQHLVGIAIQLLRKPSVLLLDDPFAGLDSLRTQQLWQLLNDLPKECSCVIASHRDLSGFDHHWRIHGDQLVIGE